MRRRRLATFAAACAVLAFFFHNGLGYNPVSRLLTVFGVVEQHTLYADRWRIETGDYAFIDGHTYSDKAPLSSLLAIPAYWVWRHFEGGPQRARDEKVANGIGVVVAGAIPFAFFAMLLLLRARREGAGPREAVWLALLAAFGTSLLSYGGSYFGHMLASALFLGGYVLACELEESFVLAGMLGGLSVATTYPLALMQVLILGYLLLGADRWRRSAKYVLGALPSAILLMAWNKAVTGGWFDLPYSHVSSQWAAMRTAFGFRYPDPAAMWELAFGQYRGLAFYAPVLLLFVPLIAIHFAGPRRRKVLTLVMLGSYFLLISSYFKWDGGWCTGPRHLAPVIALGVYEGFGAMVKLRRFRAFFVVLAVWGGLVITLGAATWPMVAEHYKHPAFQVFFPKFFKGQITPNGLPMDLGLPKGRYLLAVFYALLVSTGLYFGWRFRRDAERHPAPASPPPRWISRLKQTLVGASALAILMVGGTALAFAHSKSSHGWRGAYYTNQKFQGKPRVREDASLDFFWGTDAPMAHFPADHFAIRWEGCLRVPRRELATFWLGSDDGSRLFVDGKRIIDAWKMQSYRGKTANVWMNQGAHAIRVDYEDIYGQARVALKLGWNHKRPTPVDWRSIGYPTGPVSSPNPCRQ